MQKKRLRKWTGAQNDGKREGRSVVQKNRRVQKMTQEWEDAKNNAKIEGCKKWCKK